MYAVRYRIIAEHHTADLYSWHGDGGSNMTLDPGSRETAPRFSWKQAIEQVEVIRERLVDQCGYEALEVQICDGQSWRLKKRFRF